MLKGSKHRATNAQDDTVLLLGYDSQRSAATDSGMDAHVCNASRTDGSVCRMPRGHSDAHVPFSGELIAVTGVYVIDKVES